MFKIKASNKFLKDLKLLKRRSEKDFKLLENIVDVLAQQGHSALEKKHNAHKLIGAYSGYWECHVKPDLLLIWAENEILLLIEFVRTARILIYFKKKFTS